jgi:hypothetical protein
MHALDVHMPAFTRQQHRNSILEGEAGR